jgi:uncharacterized protein YjbI with pentapeptide repeats
MQTKVVIQTFSTIMMLVILPGSAEPANGGEFVCPVRTDRNKGLNECPCVMGWKPTEKRLAGILQASETRGFDPSLPPAVLCNADLTHANLGGAVLFQADLREAKLGHANLEGAYLNGADLRKADLRNALMAKAVLEHANLQGAKLSYANLKKAIFDDANLGGANLSEANLEEASLIRADLKGAKLFKANLAMANLDDATLSKVNGEKLNLSRARLRGADLEGASLQRSHLQGADLFAANLQDADLYLANLEGAHLARTLLARSNYAPASRPPDGYLAGMQGLRNVVFPPQQQSGVVQLRKLLRDAGLRHLEREATYAIEHNNALHDRQSGDWARQISGWLNLVFLEWTSGYGLFPQQAIYILLGCVGAIALIFAIPIAGYSKQASDKHVIIRVWPADRAEVRYGGFSPVGTEKMERLTANGPAVFGWALYFSLLSAFHFGWRDLNVGTWLSRIQPNEFGLRGRGWVRVVSGIQSLGSLYLIAIWALTYFGRPFQ